nr:DUF5801 repeats-in-toxin domain-containing protein [Halomonas sp. NO4]
MEDDGPSVSAKEGASADATLDETNAGEAFADGSIDTVIAAEEVANLFGDVDYGTDGAGTVNYSLAASSVATGLYLAGADTTEANNEIQLVADTDDGGNVTGYTGYVGGDDSTDPVFSVEIASDGTITVTQHQALEHLEDGSSASAHDDALTLDAAGIRVVQTVTDADGDSDSATSDAALEITFKDDGPEASAKTGAEAGATLDETAAGEAFENGPIDTTIDADDVKALFAAPAYGADGAGTVNYSLAASSVATGLYLAGADTTEANNEIQLVADTGDGGNVSGYTGYVGGDDSTDPVFSVEIASDGMITVLQHQALEHLEDGSSASAHDDALTLDAAGIRVVQTVTDADGDSDSATSNAALEITFKDDGPTAKDYAHDGTIEEGSEATVLAEDAAEALGISAGADGLDGSFSEIVFTNQGDTEGSLGINGAGQLVYTAPASVDNTDGDVTETFEYTVLDQDGDRVTRQVTVRVGDAHTPTIDNPEGDDVVALVDDDGLAGGNPGGPNDLDGQGGNETTFSGTLAFAYGDDGAGRVDFAAMDGESGTLGTEDITYAWDADSNVLTATIDGGERDGQDLFQVELTDAQTGDYTVSLLTNVRHTDDETDTENETDLGLTYTVTDSDGSTADGKLNITFDDDVPVSNSGSQDMTVVVNALEVGGLTAEWANVSGGSDVNIDNQPAEQDDVVSWDGTDSTSNYTFDDNDDLTGTQSVSVNSMLELGEFTHNNFPISSDSGIHSVDLNLSLDIVINGYRTTIEHTINFDHNETPNSEPDPRDGVTINNASAIVPIEITTDSGEIETYNFQIIGFVDQNGDIVEQVFTEEDASNSFKLMGQLISSDAPDVSGQVDYGFGADGPAEEDAVAWNGGTVIGNGETQVQGQFGVLTVDAEGNYTYQLDQAAYDELAAGETEVDTFTYTVTDADGDGVESSLAINITGEAAPKKPWVPADDEYLGEAQGVVEGQVKQYADSVLDNDTDSENDALSVSQVAEDGSGSGSQSLSNGPVTITTAMGGLVTIHSDGAFSYDATNVLRDHSDSVSDADSFYYKAADTEGVESDWVKVSVGILDSEPEAFDDSKSVSAGETVSENVLDNDLALDTPTSVTGVSHSGSGSVSFDNPGDVKNDGNGDYLELQGDHGTLTLYQDGSYEYSANPVDTTVTVPNDSLADWQGALGGVYGFTGTPMDGQGKLDFSALNSNAAGDVKFNNGSKKGLGVDITQSGAIDNGENLVLALGEQATGAVVSIAQFNASQAEFATWEVFDANGDLVGSGNFDSTVSSGGYTSLSIDSVEPFSYISLGVDTDGANSNQGYVVSGLSYSAYSESKEDDFTYYMQDQDGSTDEADLSFTIDGDGNDILFGDTVEHPDHQGKGFQGILDELEAQNAQAPTNDQVLDYLKDNHESLVLPQDQGGDDILIGGAGNDILYGGPGTDTFAWEFGDEGDVGAPAEDIVKDFTVVSDTDDGPFGDADESNADRLDLADLLQDEENNDIGDYIFAEEDTTNGNVVLHISSDGSLAGDKENADQMITLEGKTFADFGGDVGDSADLIQQMLDSGQLNIDQ